MDDTTRIPAVDAVAGLGDLVDVGANLTHESFARDLEEVLGRAAAVGVRQIVVTASDAHDSVAAAALAARYPRWLFATAGVHPHYARVWSAEVERTIEALARTEPVVAVGEAGLDFTRDFSPRAQQEAAFEAQLDLAARLGMSVFMHERDAHERFLAILRNHRARLTMAVIHCFTGSRAELDAYLDLDLHVGITGWICDERRGRHLRELVALIPAERLMLETDAPYLLPRDLAPRPKTRRNEPMYLPHVLRVVAGCRGEAAMALARTTTLNARHFFSLAKARVSVTS